MEDLRFTMENLRRTAPINAIPSGICLLQRLTQLESSKDGAAPTKLESPIPCLTQDLPQMPAEADPVSVAAFQRCGGNSTTGCPLPEANISHLDDILGKRDLATGPTHGRAELPPEAQGQPDQKKKKKQKREEKRKANPAIIFTTPKINQPLQPDTNP